ncbi:hypothetical protein J2W37_006015 [Variovorax paradoxus]|nr:hypothetical protein [Variovorax paradoxus]
MAERAKEDLDPLLVVPADVRINFFDELLDRGALRPKKPSHAELSGEHPLRAIERTSLASPIRDCQPGQRQ